MQNMNNIMGLGGNFVFTIAAFLFVLTIVVFFHELGHFLAARWCGVRVQTFSIGFGKEIWGFNDKYGTRWQLSWIPLGGYVKFMDDENAASMPSRDAIEAMSAEDRAGNFHAKPLWQRALIIFAGPFASLLLAVFIFAGLFTVYGQQITAALVDEIVAGSAAAEAGFAVGDRIIEIDGKAIESFSDMQRIVSLNADTPLKFTVDRRGTRVVLSVTPKRDETTDRFGNKTKRGLIGIKRAPNGTNDSEMRHYNPVSALWPALKETWFTVASSITYMGKVATGRESGDQLSGPIGIAKAAGQMASLGFGPLLQLTAFLSAGIGYFNLLPVFPLDGGHLLFYGIEAVRQRPVSERTQDLSFRIGFALVLMLMVFATRNDLLPWVQKFL